MQIAAEHVLLGFDLQQYYDILICDPRKEAQVTELRVNSNELRDPDPPKPVHSRARGSTNRLGPEKRNDDLLFRDLAV